ncbi:MAG: efflux RND transporter periplasmic adaptor subunit [bacterium]|nr:efflux RND transporter periplasmic adaptor subunit [bacterium]
MKRYLTKFFVYLIIFSMFLSINTLAVDKEQNEDEHDMHEEKAVVHMDDKTLKEFGVKIKIAKSGWVNKKGQFPGEIRIHLDYLAHITPRFPGVVKKIYHHIGDTVKKGDLLATIESNDSLTPYKIASPISGTIIEKHLTLGESIEANSHAFEIADLNTVWVTFSVFQGKIGEIKQGQNASIQSSNGKDQINGTISYVSPIVDPQTRTQMGRIELSNKNQRWKPGMFVDVNVVYSSIKGKVVVPNTAIQKIDDKPFVFVRKGDAFEPHPVNLGASDEKYVIVKSGLKARTEYVSDGGFILKAEIQKNSMDDDHSH